jgi:fumarate hydratase subunit alpha
LREITAKAITDAVAKLFQQANYALGDDVIIALKKALQDEISPAGREVIRKLLENAALAAKESLPLCQDGGAALVFLEVGQEVRITGGDLYAAINDGVRRAYTEGYLRKSMVSCPFSARENTGDNTPAIIHTEIVPGDRLKIAVLPKGGGAENMTRLAMLTPAEGQQGIIDFVVAAADEAGANPCPPVIIGVGVGGTAEKAMLLAKKALLRRVGEPNPEAEAAALEREILKKVNGLGIGPMGYGGKITALAVHVESFPTHIAALPVAVNFQCHSARHRETIL